MSSKLSRKFSLFSLIFIFLYLSFKSSVYGSSFKKIFNIQNQNKIKDMSFEFEISNIKKNIEVLYPLNNLKNFKIIIYWLSDGSFDIFLSSLPKGNKSFEKSIKLQILENLKVLFPSDKLKELKKNYEIKKAKNRLIATNFSFNRRKVIVDLDKNGLIKKIESFFPLNKLIENYEYQENSGKFLMKARLETNTAYKDNYLKKTSYEYENISGIRLPTKIEITEVIKTKLSSNSKKLKENSFKKFYFFKNYQINKGTAKSHFDRMHKEKK